VRDRDRLALGRHSVAAVEAISGQARAAADLLAAPKKSRLATKCRGTIDAVVTPRLVGNLVTLDALAVADAEITFAVGV
jgi:hypothetical protein